VSTDVGTWTNWLTFEPDPDYNPDAGTGLLSPVSYKRCYTEFYVGKIPRIRRVVLQWFYSLSRRNTFVGGTCALPSAFLVLIGLCFMILLSFSNEVKFIWSLYITVCHNHNVDYCLLKMVAIINVKILKIDTYCRRQNNLFALWPAVV